MAEKPQNMDSSTSDAEESVEATSTAPDATADDETPGAEAAKDGHQGEDTVAAAEGDAADATDATPDEAQPTPAEHIAALEAELAEMRANVATQTDQLQRLAAEFQNSKRRQEKQLADAIERAGSQILEQLLPVIDDFELAFKNLPSELTGELTDEDAAWIDGFRQIQKKLMGILSEQGVTAIPAEGAFDPNLHEAITSEPHDDIESGHIIQTLRTGYEYKGRVLRPAMVRVAS